ncbi:MAG: hypothetical protein K2M53_07640 [Muribaculaceae bacterium]|nr:hypothetical protein [Muribaculaceae bacterium]
MLIVNFYGEGLIRGIRELRDLRGLRRVTGTKGTEMTKRLRNLNGIKRGESCFAFATIDFFLSFIINSLLELIPF